MFDKIKNYRHSLVLKIILVVGIILMLSVSTWAIFDIQHNRKRMMDDIISDSDRLSDAIRLGTHYAMMFNARDDIYQIITNLGKLRGIEHIRIYNKSGQIKYSNLYSEVGETTGIKAEACDICHRSEPPLDNVALETRTRIFQSPKGHRLLGIISPIFNEPGCATSDCHAHPPEKKILGALDMVMSLEETDNELGVYQKWLAILAVFLFLVTSTFIFLFLLQFIIEPIEKLINKTNLIAKGEYPPREKSHRKDEIGHLAAAIDRMGQVIGEKQSELNQQKNEYQNLFDLVPCIISVQDRDYKLIRHNREFSEKFAPKPGDYCFQAYKKRDRKCEHCPVELTFADGLSHTSEESGFNKDGSVSHWIVKTAPITNEAGKIIAAMEINLDITQRKLLEEELTKSEKKYHAIFNNIPSPVFVLDYDTLNILDCNDIAVSVYGYSWSDFLGKSFLDLFTERVREKHADSLRTMSEINKAKHWKRNGESIFVNIRISPSEYPGRKVLLVTASDITKRLETEMQLIQTGKMATLGEMATGVAHELNQPLTVIKSASGFFIQKIRKNEKIKEEHLATLSEEIVKHVERATNIINHLREFGRKADIRTERVDVNGVLKKAFEFFGQQLKLREIRVDWDLEDGIPYILAEQGMLEQVFINLLINARDAIEEKWQSGNVEEDEEKKITLRTRSEGNDVLVEVRDSGTGISDPVADKIFEPFFTTKKVGEGTGLGLSITYGIIQDFKGTIQASSNDGRGACFMIRFPAEGKS